MNERLQEHRKIWQSKKILRQVYGGWYKQIVADLKPGSGQTLEVASGIGNFKEFHPQVIASDIEWHDRLDLKCDAHCLPFGDETLANVVMIDGLHHLADPIRFIGEADRVLEPGGRLLLLEPYPTPFSLLIYRLFHHEPFDFSVDYFATGHRERSPVFRGGNQAAAYLIFHKQRRRFLDMFSNSLRIVKTRRLSCLAYPLSGGFSRRSLLPAVSFPFMQVVEALLSPLRFLLAFRCYVVLEKK
jgi:SAM-dependent methyltransferase